MLSSLLASLFNMPKAPGIRMALPHGKGTTFRKNGMKFKYVSTYEKRARNGQAITIHRYAAQPTGKYPVREE